MRLHSVLSEPVLSFPPTLVALGLVLGGCGHLKRVVNQIDAVAVVDGEGAPGPSVTFGRLEVTENSVAESAVAAATNVAIDVFEVEMATRLTRLLSTDNLSMNTARSTSNRLEKRGPFAVDPASTWKLDVAITSWGLSADVDEPARAWTQLVGSLRGSDGKRVWSRSLSCSEPLAPDTFLGGSTAQVAMNVGTVRATPDAELQRAFRELARGCARDLVDKLDVAVAKARAKAG